MRQKALKSDVFSHLTDLMIPATVCTYLNTVPSIAPDKVKANTSRTYKQNFISKNSI